MILNKEKLFKYLIVLFLLIPTFSALAGPIDGVKEERMGQDVAFQESAGYTTTTTLGSILATVIKAFIGLLGIIFIVLIVYAGYNWMTAAGDEAKVTKAKETLQRAIIGLVIVLAAYSITYFVFSNLNNLNSPGGPTGSGT